MIKKEKGITLVSLIVTIILMTIIALTVIYMSLDRFEINSLRKMFTDIELLADKVSNYYLKYGVLPILRDDSNSPMQYTYTTLDFEKNSADNTTYYILDVEAIEGISLNYGKEGFENPNTSEDVYIINEKSHAIYYVKGMVLDGDSYHTLGNNDNISEDTIPPSSPQINVISGTKTTDEDGNEYYITDVEIEIISGRDNWSGVKETQYSLDGGTTWNKLEGSSEVYTITADGTYTIKARSYDKQNNKSETTLMIVITKEVHDHVLDEGEITKEATCTEAG